VKQTARVLNRGRRASRVFSPGWLVCAALLACQEPRGRTLDKPGGTEGADAGAAEESPNARILPEPLEEGSSSSGNADAAVDGDSPVAAPPKKREKPKPFPVAASIDDDDLRRGGGAVFVLVLPLSWREANRSVLVEG
jgi:hypothetical protein